MGNIVVLDELTINQIAAGEVIERPANVVKELVENSIDAGAKNISIEIRNGGISYIRIVDDGKGIARDDMQLAFERHATSKIRSGKDLSTVMTMGFRGEALASIAAIANVEMTSCTGNSVGNKIIVKAGDILSFEEGACPKGTVIEVKELFFNTPVRYKFLRKDFTEGGYIEDIVSKLALIHPEISFKLKSSNKVVISTNGNGDIITTIYSISGKEIADNLLFVNYEYEGMKLVGVVGKPSIARSNRSNQIMYVNTRNVKDKTIRTAIDEAYKNILPQGKFAFTMINLNIDSSLVDVNVHPAKLEIRFQNENDVFKIVYHGIREALLTNDLSRHAFVDTSDNEEVDTREKEEIHENAFDKVNSVNNVIKKDVISEINEANYDEYKPSLDNVLEDIVANRINKNENVNFFENHGDIVQSKKEYIYIGTAFSTYNIIEYMNELYIIDQHAAHERVLYERLKKSYYNDERLSQMILIPEIITLTNKEMDIVKDNIDTFEKVGYIIDSFGDNTYKISGVPNICVDINAKDLFMDVLDELQGNLRTSKDNMEDNLIATIACKAAVKGNMNLSDKEVRGLMEELLTLDNPFTCPHGRPTAIKFSKYDLERKFGRK